MDVSAHRRRFALLILLACLIPVMWLASSPAHSAPLARSIGPTGAGVPAADVHGDNAQDRYVGTGGLVLPGSVGRATRSEVAGCAECRWRLSTPCELALPGTPFPGQATCLSVVRGCPAMAELLRVWFQPAGGTWSEVGLICLRPGGPVTVSRLSGLARDRFVQDLTPVTIGQAPARGVLAQIPVVFSSGQSAEGFVRGYDLLGEQVVVTGRPRWTWQFGDGGTMVTDDPGGEYPNMAVSHPYRRAGSVDVSVRTDWRATFTVDGLGPFPISEPVSQNATRRVSVGEGRAVLAVH